MTKEIRIKITRSLTKDNAEKLRTKAFLTYKYESEILDELVEKYL